jgi:hypothetical protein
MPTTEQIAELFAIHNSPERRRELLLRSYGFDDSRTWLDPNGYRLSDRLWRSRVAVRQQIDAVLRKAMATGQDALEVAEILEQFLSPDYSPVRNALGRLIRGQRKAIVTSSPGRGGMGSFPARRLARTEITRAHGQATIMTAERTPFAKGVKWSTSASHPEADTCDGNAGRDAYNLGPGVYPPSSVPRYPEHPQCLCNLSTVVPENVDAVVDSLRDQYGLSEVATTETEPIGQSPRDVFTKIEPKAQPIARPVLNAIDDVHGMDGIPPVPIRVTTGKTQAGVYRYRGRDPIGVFVKPSGSRPELTLSHEIGHMLDHLGLGPSKGIAGSINPGVYMPEWRTAVRNSSAVRRLQTLRETGGVGVDVEGIKFALRNDELWARSYAQYIATKSGNTTLRRQVSDVLEGTGWSKDQQWSDEDFADIAAAIDRLFADKGWLKVVE